MSHNRTWKFLNWNLRGINSKKKWLAVAGQIEESACDIICLQETKREQFDIDYIRKFYHKKFNKFEYLPLIGASGGIIIMWNVSLFNGHIDFQNEFSISVKFSSNLSSNEWILTNIYGPTIQIKKHSFLTGLQILTCLMTWIGLSWGISIL
jgi:exonuclease III